MPSTPLTLIYLSQTGQSQAICESFHDQALTNNFDAQLFCIKDFDKKFNLKEQIDPVVFVCSTTGDGDLPETAFKFWNKLKRMSSENDELKNLKYAFLGLGDTNYTDFCGGPKKLHSKLQDLEADCFYGPFWADDGTGLDLVVEPFKDGLWQAMKTQISPGTDVSVSSIENTLTTLSLTDTDVTVPVLADKILSYTLTESDSSTKSKSDFIKSIHSPNDILTGTITSNTIMTSQSALKTCHNIKFSTSIDFKYEPGDSINVICPNEPNEVNQLLKRLDLVDSAAMVIRLTSDNPKKITGKKYADLTDQNQINLFDFFTYCVDIRTTSMKKGLIRMLANYCSEKTDETRLLELCSREGAEHFQSMLKDSHLTLLDLLNQFSSCHPPLDYLIQNLQPLNQRAYSLCSFYNPHNETNELEIIFNLVNFDALNGRTYPRNGIATGYLSGTKTGDQLHFIRRKFQSFTFPSDTQLITRPIFMVGPGTGIAPFISYLRSRSDHHKDLKGVSVFYGCRDPEKDFLFKSELITYARADLCKLSLSFSRIDSCVDKDLLDFWTPGCRYVQDSMRMKARKICRGIYENEGYVYVCGDASGMSRDVVKCLAECLVEEYGIDLESANKYLIDMMIDKRFKQDIWA